jgi:hypothetical protein
MEANMNIKILSSAAAIFAAAGLSSPVLALEAFTVTPGAVLSVPTNNDFKGTLAGLGLTEYTATGASVMLNLDRQLKFEYVGSESGAINFFKAGGLAAFAENNMGAGSGNFSPVLIGFDNFTAGALSNVSFYTDISDQSFAGSDRFGIFLPSGGTFNSNVLYLGFDDMINNFDDNHDDFIVRVTAVPEPAAWLSMILGFGLLGAAARRQRSASMLQSALC